MLPQFFVPSFVSIRSAGAKDTRETFRVLQKSLEQKVLSLLASEQAKYARKLSGKLYIGDNCDIYKCDVAQIYADEELAADNFYYGVPWRVPANLMCGKECYLVMSEMKDDFYKEF